MGAARCQPSTHTYAWYLGYGGIPLCEYYLRTGDKVVLPAIQRWVDSAVKREYLGGWSQKGGVGSVTYGGGGGHLNAGGTAVVTFLKTRQSPTSRKASVMRSPVWLRTMAAPNAP